MTTTTNNNGDGVHACEVELIDTHAHLSFPAFDDDRDAALARAWEAGLGAIVLVGSGAGLKGNEEAIALAETDARLFATVGGHPHEASEVDAAWMERMEQLAANEKVVAIGEIGLDFHYDHSPHDVQRRIFAEMLALARRIDKPVVIHDREAHEETWALIEESGVGHCGGVFHCFSGDVAFAERAIDAGFLISIPGIVTFPKASVLHDVVRAIPIERMLIETDCPFLAPVPHRGKRNEPAFVRGVAEKIAALKGLAFEDVARITTLNARRLFGLPGVVLAAQIAYPIRNALYLNITNRCSLACRFCTKAIDFEVKGHYLKLEREPSVQEVLDAIGDPNAYEEIVFCGYGEPTLRIDVVEEVARALKKRGVRRIRLNTDGLASLVHGRDIPSELAGLIDAVSVSLNAPEAKAYVGICPSKHGEAAYKAVCAFITDAKRFIPEVVASIVAMPGVDVEACRKKAAQLGVELRVREYMNVG